MKTTLYILFFFIVFSAYSQQKAIEITNIKTGKTKVFEENQRVKIRTLNGKKIIGALHFSDSETLMINKHTIKLDSLQSIKKQQKTLGVIRTIVLATGLTVVGSSLIAASKGNNSAFLLFTIGSATTISSGIIEENY
jgi:translation initiation factor 6 (eIF-6)